MSSGVTTKAATTGTRTLGYARTEAPPLQVDERGWSVPIDAAVGNVHLEPGTVLKNTYRIDGLIASGGMGDVYRATHLRLQGGVAIKMLHRDLLNEDGLLTRFRTEAKIMAGIHHPHVVHVFDFDVTDDGVPYLAMELAEGSDLRTLSGELQRTMSPLQVSQIVSQIASALGAAHAHGVVHRDLKPENVVLVPLSDGSACAKVVDFGVSKARGIPPITVESALIGTPEFMAPEQAQGQSDLIDHRTDQFALGILAYFMFTGREPFRGATPVAVLYQVIHEEAPSMRGLVSWPCRHIDAVIRRAMAKQPERRYPTIQEFGQALEEAVQQDLGQEARLSHAPALPAAEGSPDRKERRKRRRRDEAANATVFPAARRPWRMALFVMAAVCTATLLLCMNAQPGAVSPPQTASMAYHRLADGAARIMARVRSGGPLAISASAVP